MVELIDNTMVNAPLESVYEKLLNPKEQLKWNTLYLEASTKPDGPIKDGTVMTGLFKGSGKATVTFENVIPNKEFTHFSKLMIFNMIYLGDFRHTYKVEDVNGSTKFTQKVVFEPKGLGKIMIGTIMKGFKSRLPESFKEFKAYAEHKM